MVLYSPDDTPPYSISTTALYTCNAGFSLVGEATSQCVDGNDQATSVGIWTGTPPVCLGKASCFSTIYIYAFPVIAIQCSTLNIENGMISYTPDATPPYSINTMANYTCNTGFSLMGNALRACVDDNDQADTNGTWNGTDPSCQG